MSDFFKLSEELASNLNSIQPVADDFFADGTLDQYARIDHQHPLSESLRTAIYNSTLYIKKSGDTMTGPLTLTTSHIYLSHGYAVYFNSPTNTNLIYGISSPSGHPWHSGFRIQGVDGFSFYNNIQGSDVLGYRGASGTYYFWIGNKVLVGSTPSDALATEVLNINGNISMLGSGSIKWTNQYNAPCIWMQDATWVRITPNLYCVTTIAAGVYVVAGGSVPIWNLTSYGGVYSTSAFSGTQCAGRSSGGAWNNSAIQAAPQTATASICFHNGGYAPVIGSTSGTGNNLYFRDGSFNGNSCALFANSYNADSSLRWKKNINNWPLRSGGAAVECAIDLISKLRVVSYQSSVPYLDTGGKRRSSALLRLDRYRAKRNLEPFDYKMPEHDCSIHSCDGTSINLCIPKIQAERERIGFIAEEVYEVLPNAVPVDAANRPEAIDLGQMLAISIAAIQELTERVNHLEEVA